MSIPSLSPTEFLAFTKRAGFSLTPEQAADYYVAYGYVEKMAALVRQPRSHMAEPAHTFSAAEGSAS